MSIDWLRRKNASNKIKFAVDAYIHEQEKMLNTNSFFNTVPQLINYIVTCYYNSSDSWDEKNVAKNMHIVKNCVALKTNKQGNAFLTNIIAKDKFMWTFEIKKMAMWLNIGIWNTSRPHPGTEKYYFIETKDMGYCFDARYGQTENWNIFDKRFYGVACNDGDTIKMILDMNELTLTYVINGKDYGAAFRNIDRANYKAVVYMASYSNCESCVELISSEY